MRLVGAVIALLLPAPVFIGSAGAEDVRERPGWLPLFNGHNLDGFYTYRKSEGRNNDPLGVFKVEGGLLHFLDLADTTRSQENGYLATEQEFRNYRLRLEYRWGAKKFPVPNHGELPRDSGLLYHLFGPDAIWPPSVELQIQEGDTGDVWLLWNDSRPTAEVTTAARPDLPPEQYQYQPGGTPVRQTGKRIVHSAPYDDLTGWNTVELYATEDAAVHVVNGHVNNAVSRIRQPDGAPLDGGRIALQAEANEVFFRNVEIRPLAARPGGPAYRVLVFSRTAGYRHASIPQGIAAIERLGERFGFTADATEDAAAFRDDNLKRYAAVVFLSTTGDVLDDAQQLALQRYVRAGGGFVGVHSATDTEYGWPWYGRLVGARFADHPKGTPTATVRLIDATHPSTSSLPFNWTRTDEWYNFKLSPTGLVHVLATVDEQTYAGGSMGEDHPIAWYRDFEGGRSWYTALGHTPESFSDPLFLFHLLGGIQYAAVRAGLPPAEATVLFDGKDVSAWAGAKGGPLPWTVRDGALEVKPGTGDIQTKESYQDFDLHLEFRVPATAPASTGTESAQEQARGDSGISLQGRYEVQILDSFDRPLRDANDCGAVFGVKDAAVNASQPAETWQTYDITFRAARWRGPRKVANARVTVYLNGVLVQKDVEVPRSTTKGAPEGPAPGPVLLQEHSSPVRFRNIWIRPLETSNDASAGS